MTESPLSEVEQNIDPFKAYMSNGFSQVQGWSGNRRSVEFNACFRALFSETGETGGVCEIGVHHGKYLIALHNIFYGRRSLGIDLFDNQGANVDGSGRGDINICQENILKFAREPELVLLRASDSTALSQKDLDDITLEFGKFAILSVDGGHTKLHICIDLDNATKLVSDKGIVIVDDFFHPDWPEVTEGLYHSISTQRTYFVPFLITRKKMYLCHLSRQSKFAKFVVDNRGTYVCKHVRFAGWNVPSINFGSEY